MGGLAHVIEGEGIPTVVISLIREHTERMKPPRGLFVPFSFGRPFGAPNDAAFQGRVLRAALALLERTDGPILEDFPDPAPSTRADGDAEEMEGWTCPINLKPPSGEMTDSEKLIAAIEREIALLRPWYDEAVEKSGGRRLDGLTGYTPEESARHLIAFTDDPAIPSFVNGEPLARAIKFCADDLKHYYYQAALARPAPVTDSELDDWFFGETFGGLLLLAVRAVLVVLDDPVLQRVGLINILPHAMRHHAERGQPIK